MDYIYIRAWHRMTGSFDYYIEDQVAKARADKAPETAVYFDNHRYYGKNRWVTLEECAAGTQERVKTYIKSHFKIDV